MWDSGEAGGGGALTLGETNVTRVIRPYHEG